MKKATIYFLTFFFISTLLENVFGQTILVQENFSTASGETPPTGWTSNVISGAVGDKWKFNNPGGRTINSPVSGNFAIFDSDNYSDDGTAEDVTFETPAFDASSYTILTLDFDHYFRSGAGGAYAVDVFDGSSWTTVDNGSTTTGNPDSESIDILSEAGGSAVAKVRFRWTGNFSWYWAVDNVEITGDFIPDNDGDGIADADDLDDDNDGIPDLIEAGVTCIETIILTGGSGGKIYQTNLVSGVTTLYTTSNLVVGNINGLASNPDAGVLYYAFGTSIYVYNPATTNHQLVQDLSGLITGGNLESGGASYFNGNLYIGPEDGSGLITDVYQIPLAADGLSFTSNPVGLGANNSQGGFGDFVVKSESTEGVIYGSTSVATLWSFDIGSSAYSVINGGTTAYQMAVDFSGQVWSASGTTLRRLDDTGTPFGSSIVLTENSVDLTGPFNCPQPDYNRDSDGDGIVDYLDLDSDNDGIPDIIEAGGVDSNGDGVIDYPTPGDPTSMTDTDNDGLADVYDSNNGGANIPNPDTDGDGIKDYLDLDADGDGIPDLIEAGGIDGDGDGRVDVDVSNIANDADSDGYADIYDSDDDGTPGVDAGEATAPLVLTTDSGADGLYDAITNGSGTSLDSDGDGYADALDLDADNDGIPDIIEANGIDSDGDGRVDTGADADGDGLADIYDSDASDGPAGTGTDGSALVQTDGTDTNGNYKSDDAAIVFEHGDGTVLDSDGDGLPDYIDLDADNDGIPDIVEANGIDSDGDGRVDTGTDADNDGLADIYDSDADDGPGGTGTDGSALVQTDGTDTDSDGLADDVGIIWEHGDGTVLDSDGDGLPDYIDLDADNDGIPDIIEANGVDSDGDGRVDTGTDADNDGLADIYDSDADDGPGGTGTDGSALVQTDGTDTDSDGLADDVGIIWEHGDGTVLDSDGDGLPDYIDLDADNDGIPDIIEANGVDSDGDGRVDTGTDADNDGLADIYDSDADDGPGGTGTDGSALVQTDGTDTDSDGLADDVGIIWEHGDGTVLDSDGDGLPDYIDLDADNDGIPDIIEANGVDSDGDGRVDTGTDADNDGLADIYDSDADDGPGGTGTDGSALVQTDGTDTDSDGLADDVGIIWEHGDGTVLDSDGDGLPDYLDLDADNDGLPDIIEAGGVDTDGDGRTDVSTDADQDGLVDIFDSDADDGPGGTGTDGSALVKTGGTDTDADGIADDAAIVWEHGNGSDIDADGDGLPEFIDLDADNDGIPDIVEAGGVDANGDGRTDTSTDADGDGLVDIFDSDASDGPAGTGTNGVSLVQTNGTDTGSDGLADGDSGVGYRHGGSATDIDTDGDNIQDWLDIDADNDGVPDVIEAGGLDANGDGYVDLSTDADNDGLVDAYDSNASDGPGSNGTNGVALVQTGGTDTGSDGLADGDAAITFQNGSSGIWPDWDGDGVPNHLDRDADNDGIADIIESGGVDVDRDGIVDGAFTDTDGDGFSNTFDADNTGTAIITTGIDTDFDNLPDSYSDDTDTDIHPNFADIDADNDGILDNLEAQTTSGYSAAGTTDSDGDGILDEYDGGNLLIPTNTGGISAADYLDIDSDGDGLLDKHEAWDRHDDGDGVIDLSCLADADDDGLLDCYDNDSGDASDQTLGVTPPTDNGFDGTGYTNSNTSTGATAEDLFPNNGGIEAQPDWRDSDNCSLSPSLVYPITGTGYLFSSGTHSLSAATTGTIRSTVFCDDAVEAGYTYYFPAIEPDKVLFAIDHATNSNNTKVDYVELRRDEAANRMAKSGSQGHFVMGRDWFVQTIDDDALTGNVNVRFYFDPADSTAIADSAANFATKWGTTLESPKWFKVDDVWNNGDISAGDGLSGLTGYVELGGNYGTEGGLHYVQFNNISGFSGGGMIIEVSGTLPVELIEFKAVAQGPDAMISWATATEENTERFVIEKSAGGTQFETIGKVQAAGTSQGTLNYNFTDENAGLQNRDRWLYRLKMIDLDGTYTYSNISEANWTAESLIALEVYPNPGSEQINIHYSTSESGSIQAFDVQGRKIWQQSISEDELKKTLSLDVSAWSTGIYSFQIRGKQISRQIRFVKK